MLTAYFQTASCWAASVALSRCFCGVNSLRGCVCGVIPLGSFEFNKQNQLPIKYTASTPLSLWPRCIKARGFLSDGERYALLSSYPLSFNQRMWLQAVDEKPMQPCRFFFVCDGIKAPWRTAILYVGYWAFIRFVTATVCSFNLEMEKLWNSISPIFFFDFL